MNLTSQLVCIVCKIKSSLFTSVIIVKVLEPGKVGMLMDCFVTSQMFNDTCLFVDGFFNSYRRFPTATCYNIFPLLPNADNEPPTVLCPNTVASMNVDPRMTGDIVTWSPSPTANDAVDGFINSATIVCEDSLGNVTMSDTLYSVGLTTVTCRANDTALNEGSCEFNITVVGRYCLI